MADKLLTFVCWKWQPKGYRVTYTAEHVNIWAAMIKRHYKKPHRLICVTDDPEGIEIETFPLWDDCSSVGNPNGGHLPSCFRRLKIFSRYTTAEMDIDEGSRVVSLDLDIVVVKDLVPMLQHDVDFLGWKGQGAVHPVVYNGTFFMFRAGKMQYLWDDFDPVTSPSLAVNAKYFGSDQGWLSYRLSGSVPGLQPRDGLLSYSRDVRSLRQNKLPGYARIVSFNGKIKPWTPAVQQECSWVREHWRL